MSPDTYGYTLFAALFGMAIVFVFLSVLSVLMVAIKRAFDNRPARVRTRSPQSASPQDAALPPWVAAAVVAFLMAEERAATGQASPWTQRRTGA